MTISRHTVEYNGAILRCRDCEWTAPLPEDDTYGNVQTLVDQHAPSSLTLTWADHPKLIVNVEPA